MAAWRPANDPTIYGTLSLDAGPALAYLEEVRVRTGVRATITHLVGRAVALALRETPDINGRIVGRRFLMRLTVDLSFQVATDGGRDLSIAKVARADDKDVHEIAAELRERVEKIRQRRDPEFERTRRITDRLPGPLLRPVLRFFAHLANDRAWDVPLLHVHADPFGSAMITSVGMFGLDVGYAPIFPLANTPILVLVGEVQDRPVARDGQVVVRPMINLNVTLDHRLVDGFQAGRMAQTVRRYFEAPAEHEVTKLLAPGPGETPPAIPPPESPPRERRDEPLGP